MNAEESSVENIDLDEGYDINDCQKKLGFIEEDSDASKDIYLKSSIGAFERISAEEFEQQATY